MDGRIYERGVHFQVRTPKDKYNVGATAHITEHVKYDLEIMESLENEKMTFRSKGLRGGRVAITLTFLLEPIEKGTKVTYEKDYETPGGIIEKELDKLVGQRVAGKDMEKSLEKLKSILEK